jgi:hypothetical protein
MPAMLWTLGKKYRFTVIDPETGDELISFESHFYGVETDKTDYWYRLSYLPPVEREEIRD